MPQRPEKKGPQLTPVERQFAMALRMLRTSLDNMDVAFDALLQSRSPSETDKTGEDAADQPGGRKFFGDRALRAVQAGERLQAADEATSSDAARSSTVEPSTARTDNGTEQPA
jgi:hypothetical protein